MQDCVRAEVQQREPAEVRHGLRHDHGAAVLDQQRAEVRDHHRGGEQDKQS